MTVHESLISEDDKACEVYLIVILIIIIMHCLTIVTIVISKFTLNLLKSKSFIDKSVVTFYEIVERRWQTQTYKQRNRYQIIRECGSSDLID